MEEKPRSVEEVAAVSIVTDLRMDPGGPARYKSDCNSRITTRDISK